MKVKEQEQGEPFDVQIYRAGKKVYGLKTRCTAIVGSNNAATLITTSDVKLRIRLAAAVQLYLDDLIKIIEEDSIFTGAEVRGLINALNMGRSVDSARKPEVFKGLFDYLQGGE